MNLGIKQSELTEQELESLDILFSFLDKGIEDMKAGNVYTFEEAFRMLEEAR